MIDISDKAMCCGCNACGDVCAHDAITFKTDIEGFWYPEVDKSKCNNCGLCEKVCPIINIDKLKKNDFEVPKCYAAIHKNLEVRFDSTSGGLFSAFAEKMYRDRGYVGGAIYDENFNVKQFISNDKKDLLALRSSKYTQSSCVGFFKQVKEILKSGEKVLVCGCPCQMAALRIFLRKPYENLIIADFVCRGINSPMIGTKFRESLERKEGSKVIWQKAKNKELGWYLMAAKYIFANGKSLFIPSPLNGMTRGYLQTNAFCRPSCYSCKFKGMPRIADITLADCWGIEKFDPSMDDNVGTSLVLVNSEKGAALFEDIRQKIKCIEFPFEEAVLGNPSIMKSLSPSKVDREQFFKDAQYMNFEDLEAKYFPVPNNSSVRIKLKNTVCCIRRLIQLSFGSPYHFLKLVKLNFLPPSSIHPNIQRGGYIALSRYTVWDIHPKANIILNARFHMGSRRVHGSKLESRLLVEESATLQVDSNFSAGYGCDIEVFKGASLIIHNDFGNFKGGGPNMGLTLICGDHIEIGEDCRIGRNVTIRDNNGGHHVSLQGYKTSKPVIIGKHVWLCEGCTIMQGVKIGDGAIISAHTVVTTNVPPYSLVAGNPARVVQTDVHWKY